MRQRLPHARLHDDQRETRERHTRLPASATAASLAAIAPKIVRYREGREHHERVDLAQLLQGRSPISDMNNPTRPSAPNSRMPNFRFFTDASADAATVHPASNKREDSKNLAMSGVTMKIDEAEELLAGLPLVPVMAGSIAEMKALRDRCLAAGIPVLVGCPPGAGKG